MRAVGVKCKPVLECSHLQGLSEPKAFLFGGRDRFSAPACNLQQRRAQLPSRLAEGYREAARSGLDGSEHGATLDQVGSFCRTLVLSEGSSPSGAGNAPQTCIRWGPAGPSTMMQSYASAAKLRGGGPILSRGTEAMSNVGLPPPRIVICGPFCLSSRRNSAAQPASG